MRRLVVIMSCLRLIWRRLGGRLIYFMGKEPGDGKTVDVIHGEERDDGPEVKVEP